MTALDSLSRSRPVGAEVRPEGVFFRVWAPRRKSVNVVLVERGLTQDVRPLAASEDGYFSGLISGIAAGQQYFYQVDDDPRSYPDPASCFQPSGVHGPSEVIDFGIFPAGEPAWSGVTLHGQILYELHIGTWTPEGTWAAAAERLPHLADLGITLIEVMPVHEFHGQFGWGYDGVFWYAPTHLYGRPKEFRAFVDAAHRLGLGVILDVVYNHFGPVGNYTAAFSPHYVSSQHSTEWGDAINFDGEQSQGVREFMLGNVACWIRDYQLDGLRLDATQSIVDDSQPHILAELAQVARLAAGERNILIYAEDSYQRAQLVDPPDQDGFGLDGLWNDDFHHACRVAATGHAEYYYSDYSGSPQELISATKFGYLYQGQWNQRQQKHRGSPAWHLTAARFVNALQNHDQVANSPYGLRGHQLTSPGRWRALTALMFLAPGTPLLFMGQEFLASTPFLYFADMETDIAELVRQGRWSFLREFPRIAGAEANILADPSSRETCDRSKLDWEEADPDGPGLRLHRDLIRLRRTDPTFSRQDASQLQGAVVGPEAFLLRWLDGAEDRLLIVNLGRDLEWRPASEPLLAPPRNSRWKILWSSEAPKYGGTGTAVLNMKKFFIPGHAAIVLKPDAVKEQTEGKS